MARQSPTCAACGSAQLVRARMTGAGGLVLRKGARCLDCGHRCQVSAADFAELRLAELGEPWETSADRREIMRHTPMTFVQGLTCVIALTIGLALGSYLAIKLESYELAAAVGLPFVFGGWWVGRWLSPRKRPAVRWTCPSCNHVGHDTASDRCPTCGTLLDHPNTPT